MEQSRSRELKGYFQVFIGGALWGTIGLFVMLMNQYGSTSALTSFLRMFFAFLILAVVTVVRFGPRSLIVDKGTLLSCILLGLICQGIYNVFYTLAVIKTGVTISSVLLRIAPVFTAIVSFFLFSEKITKIKAIALVLNIFGCILAVTGAGSADIQVSFIGILCGVGAGFCYALTPIIGKVAGTNANAFVVSTYSYLFAAIFLGIFMKPWSLAVTFSKELILSGFGFALIPTAIAYVIYYQGIQKIEESSKVPVIASVEAVVAAILGVLLFDEHVGAINIVGIVLVIFSIGLMNRKANERLTIKSQV